jgi:ribosomal protein S18 acetylase RimI-like enzyme
MIEDRITIRLAAPADADCIGALSRDVIEQGLGWKWTGRRVRRAIRDRSTNVVVAKDAETLLGFGIMRYGEDTANLDLLAVRPGDRRYGTGARLLRWLEQVATTAGVFHIHLQVRERNEAARRFYEAAGYRVVDRAPGYYRGLESAVIMYRYAGAAACPHTPLAALLPEFGPATGRRG